MSLQKAKPVQTHLMPGSFFKSVQSKKPKAVCWQQVKNPVNVPQGQLKNNEPNVPEVPDVQDVTTNQQQLQHRGMNIHNLTGTPLDLHQPRGKFVPAPKFTKYKPSEICTRSINMNKVLPGFSWSHRRVLYVSPRAKEKLANKIVTTALKGLGNVVGSVSEQNKSFDHEEYIRQLGDKAKALHE